MVCLPESYLDWARRYAELGLPVIPLHTVRDGVCSCKERAACTRPGKHPRTTNGVRDATTDLETVAN